LSYPVVKLRQFATSPATIHYDAVYWFFQYLSGTRNDGLIYTRPVPMTLGPVLKHTPLRSQPIDRIDEHVPTENLTTLYGYSDAEWAIDIRHRRSISGMIFFLSGAAVAWKTRVQPTVALITAESEFLAASDTGRLGIFILAVLTELLQPQHAAKTVYEDSDACRMFANSTATTRQMRHIAIRDFALQDWTERNLISLTACASNANASDMFTKQVGKFFLPSIMITFPAVPRSFRLVLTFSMSPDHRLEPGGVLLYRPVVPGFPQPRLIIIA
jgi:hypothetical protein